MNEMIKTPVADEEVFAAFKPRSLGEIWRECDAGLEGTALRDTRSAFRFVAQKLSVNLDEVPGTAPEVRDILDRLSPAVSGVSPKRLENIKSLIRKAVERFGSKRVWITREVTLSPEWNALMKLILVPRDRWALSRLAAYCTIKRLAPIEVHSDTLIGFERALEAESLSKGTVTNSVLRVMMMEEGVSSHGHIETGSGSAAWRPRSERGFQQGRVA